MTNADSSDDNSLTTEKTARWEFLSSIVALITGLSLPLFIYLHSEGYIALNTVGLEWYLLYFGGYAAAIKYSLGKGEFTALREMIK